MRWVLSYFTYNKIELAVCCVAGMNDGPATQVYFVCEAICWGNKEFGCWGSSVFSDEMLLFSFLFLNLNLWQTYYCYIVIFFFFFSIVADDENVVVSYYFFYYLFFGCNWSRKVNYFLLPFSFTFFLSFYDHNW